MLGDDHLGEEANKLRNLPLPIRSETLLGLLLYWWRKTEKWILNLNKNKNLTDNGQ
jgi:hypothetical protein